MTRDKSIRLEPKKARAFYQGSSRVLAFNEKKNSRTKERLRTLGGPFIRGLRIVDHRVVALAGPRYREHFNRYRDACEEKKKNRADRADTDAPALTRVISGLLYSSDVRIS